MTHWIQAQEAPIQKIIYAEGTKWLVLSQNPTIARGVNGHTKTFDDDALVEVASKGTEFRTKQV